MVKRDNGGIVGIRKKLLIFIGIGYLLLGIIVVLASFRGITGFIIAENLSGDIGKILGIVFFVIGILVLMNSRSYKEYDNIAKKIYEKLGERNAYGHHVENIDYIERFVAGGNISKSDVNKVIMEEVSSGRLDKDRSTISISMNRDRLREVLENYGGRIKKSVRERLEELAIGRTPVGVR